MQFMPNKQLTEACKNGDFNSAKEAFRHGAITGDFYDKRRYIEYACESGNRELVDFLIARMQHVTDLELDLHFLESCLYAACKGGHREIADIFIARGANLAEGIRGACEGKHVALAEQMFAATNYNYNLIGMQGVCRCGDLEFYEKFKKILKIPNAWSDYLIDACIGGNIEIVKDVILHCDYSFDNGFITACVHCNFDIVKLTFEHVIKRYEQITNIRNLRMGIDRKEAIRIAQSTELFNTALTYACKHGSLDTVKFLLEIGADRYNKCLYIAAKNGHREIVELLLAHGADYFNGGLIGACESGFRDVITMMIARGASDFDGGLRGACTTGRRDIAELMINYGAKNLTMGLLTACRFGHVDLIMLMVKHGAILNVGDLLGADMFMTSDVRRYLTTKFLLQRASTAPLKRIIRRYIKRWITAKRIQQWWRAKSPIWIELSYAPPNGRNYLLRKKQFEEKANKK